MTATLTGAAKIAANARTLAEFLDTFPYGLEAPTHQGINDFHKQPTAEWLIFGEGDDQRARAAAIVRAIGGKWDKRVTGEHFRFTQRHPSGVALQIVVNREQVCTARVVGSTTVTKRVPVRFEEVTETVDEIEWDCLPLLADGGTA